MKIQPAVLKETRHIAFGVILGDILMIVVFLLLKQFDYTVVLGALLGGAFAVLNFLLMGIAAQRALEDPETARVKIQKSYTLRMLMLLAVMAVGIAAPIFHSVAVILPFLMPSLTIYGMRLLGMYKFEGKGGGAVK